MSQISGHSILVTEERLRQDLRSIGVAAGATLIVHSSLKSLGWVLGGAPTVVRALINVIGDESHLVMPAASPQCADPVTWREPKIPPAWLEDMRKHLPLFDVDTTPTTLGAIAETFRNWPETVRSHHPLESVCARGPHATEIVRDHPLAFSEGPGSPFARLHDLDSLILLLGVGFNRCTALHFAESLMPSRRTMTVRFPQVDAGQRVWMEVLNVADDNDTHFPLIGNRYMDAGRAQVGLIGQARSILFPMRDLVAFACEYFGSLPPEA